MAISLNKRRFFLVHPRTHQKAPSIPSPPDNIRDWCSQRHVSATGDITGLGFWDVGERMRCSRCVCHHVCRLLLYECSEPTTVFSLDRDLSVSYPGLSNLLQLFPASMLIWHSVQVAEKRALHQPWVKNLRMWWFLSPTGFGLATKGEREVYEFLWSTTRADCA